MENELLGFVPGLLNPKQQALAEQRARFSGLTNLGLALLQSGYGQPGQPRQSVGQALVQAAPQALQAYQGGFDQTLRQIIFKPPCNYLI
jgi:hypothetical protein